MVVVVVGALGPRSIGCQRSELRLRARARAHTAHQSTLITTAFLGQIQRCTAMRRRGGWWWVLIDGIVWARGWVAAATARAFALFLFFSLLSALQTDADHTIPYHRTHISGGCICLSVCADRTVMVAQRCRKQEPVCKYVGGPASRIRAVAYNAVVLFTPSKAYAHTYIHTVETDRQTETCTHAHSFIPSE